MTTMFLRAEPSVKEASSFPNGMAHTHAFINKFYREKFSFPPGIAPGPDLTFVGDTGTNSPPKNQTGNISVWSLSHVE